MTARTEIATRTGAVVRKPSGKDPRILDGDSAACLVMGIWAKSHGFDASGDGIVRPPLVHLDRFGNAPPGRTVAGEAEGWPRCRLIGAIETHVAEADFAACCICGFALRLCSLLMMYRSG